MTYISVLYTFVSQMFCRLFLYGIIDWTFKDISVRNIEGQMVRSTYAIGGRCKRTCAYDGGGG